jgi:hypothetical protein
MDTEYGTHERERERINMYRVLEREFQRPRRGCEVQIKMYLKETEWESVDWSHDDVQ